MAKKPATAGSGEGVGVEDGVGIGVGDGVTPGVGGLMVFCGSLEVRS